MPIKIENGGRAVKRFFRIWNNFVFHSVHFVSAVRNDESSEEKFLTDPLTGIFNRRAFDELSEEEWHRLRGGRSTLSVVYLDVNNFKDINDRLGHEAGDRVLEEVGRILRECSRSTDVVAVPGRIGGDEFGVLLPNTSADEASAFVGRVCRAMVTASEKLSREFREDCSFACSFGVAESAQESAETIRGLRKVADSRLYADKKSNHKKCQPVLASA
jgi:diguanylate cyclase (GGDEF)-like protein